MWKAIDFRLAWINNNIFFVLKILKYVFSLWKDWLKSLPMCVIKKECGGGVWGGGVPEEKGGRRTNCRTLGASMVFLLRVQQVVLDGSGKTAVAILLSHKLLNAWHPVICSSCKNVKICFFFVEDWLKSLPEWRKKGGFFFFVVGGRGGGGCGTQRKRKNNYNKW